MKHIVFGLLAAVALATNAAAGTINVGDLFYLQNQNGTTQFFLDNFTGPDLCFSPDAPICTALTLTGTLSYSYLNDASETVTGSAAIGPVGPISENNFNAYSPDAFILPSLNILTASFTGTFEPVDFSIDLGGGVLGPYHSTGVVVSTAFEAGYAFLVTSEAETGPAVPEPATPILMVAGGLALAATLRRRHL